MPVTKTLSHGSLTSTLVIAVVAASLFGAVYPVGQAHAQCEAALPGTGDFWVSSFSTDEIFRFSAAGQFLDAISHPELDGPRSLTVTSSGEIYVASQNSDRVIVFDAAGNFVRDIVSSELDGPTGGVVGPNGDYFVCSFSNNRILRFDPSDNIVSTYVSPGLSGPNCIVFYPDDTFVVTGQLSNDVHRFAADGTPIDSFDTGQSSVMGAALDPDGRLLVAAGSSSDVQLFDCAGSPLDLWTIPGGPQSIAIREDGTIFITTFFSNEVLQFAPNGDLLSSWNGGIALRGIEFFPASPPEFIRGDVDGSQAIDLSDAVAILSYLFVDGFNLLCPDAADLYDTGSVDISDAVGVLAYLFSSGAAPLPPFPNAGTDPTPDSLGCVD